MICHESRAYDRCHIRRAPLLYRNIQEMSGFLNGSWRLVKIVLLYVNPANKLETLAVWMVLTSTDGDVTCVCASPLVSHESYSFSLLTFSSSLSSAIFISGNDARQLRTGSGIYFLIRLCTVWQIVNVAIILLQPFLAYYSACAWEAFKCRH